MAKVKFDRNAELKKIDEIKVKDKEVIQQLPFMPISTNWAEYKKIAAIPEKI